MFWSKKQETKEAPKVEAKEVKAEVKTEVKVAAPKPKVSNRPLTPTETIVQQIEGLSDGQTLVYQLVERYGGGFTFISLNPKYPGKKQHKYVLVWGLEKDITPGKERLVWSSDKAKELANWVLDRGGERIS